MKLIALTSFMFDRPIAGGSEFDCECPINAHSLVSTGVARYKSADAGKQPEQSEAAEPEMGVEEEKQEAEPEQPKPEQPKRRRK